MDRLKILTVALVAIAISGCVEQYYFCADPQFTSFCNEDRDLDGDPCGTIADEPFETIIGPYGSLAECEDAHGL